VFDQLRADVDAVAAIHGMQDVFKLRAADIYRVQDIELIAANANNAGEAGEAAASTDTAAPTDVSTSASALGELTARLGRSPDLDTLVGATVDGLAELLGYDHSLLLLLDEQGKLLYTIASHGYEAEGVGSEVAVGEGIIGMAAARCTPIRLGNLRAMTKYSRTVRRVYEDRGDIGPGHEIPVPGLPLAESRVAVPAMALGQLVAVLVVESPNPVAFGPTDEALLTVVASIVANAIEAERARDKTADPATTRTPIVAPAGTTAAPTTTVRFFPVDGSTFLDGDYLIKGVAGRLLWSLLTTYESEGRTDFTNREVRLDPSLELPEFRDNFESRLILLKRRLDERDAPIRIDKTGRGRFSIAIDTALRLDAAD
jgi:hypothetical protein